jgi:hypothetical protein
MEKRGPVRFDVFSMVRPCLGESVSGDAAVCKVMGSDVLAAMIDVLGHGAEANQLARVLEAGILGWDSLDLRALMERLHATAIGTRGAAAGLAALDAEQCCLRFFGVGNTRIRKFGQESWSGISRDGVLGDRLPALREERVDLNEGDVVVLYSDGVKEHINQKDYPRLTLETPATIAGSLISRYGKAYDDASCMVIKCRS